MARMNKIRIAITLMLLLLFIWANFYTVRKVVRYGVELYLYDKLLVAYQIGGMPGLKSELKKETSQYRMPRELTLAREFEKKLEDIKFPGDFLEKVINEKKEKIKLFKKLRIVAFVFIAIILLLRIVLNLCERRSKNQKGAETTS